MLCPRVYRFAFVPLLAAIAVAQPNDSAYAVAMSRAGEAKGAGDYAAMADAIRDALKEGPGVEYDWRSLAWALMNSGEWEDSLGVARENVARHGETGWTLEQLAESQMRAGYFREADATLARAEALGEPATGSAWPAIVDSRARLADLTGQRRYRLHWRVDLGQGGPEREPARMLMPRAEDPHQTFEFTVTGVHSWEAVSEGERDFVEVVQEPGKPFDIDATVTIRGYALGAEPLSRAREFVDPTLYASLLGPFQHGETFDPESPMCSRVAGMCRSSSAARTVQNLLDWMSRNMVYADTTNRTVDEILAGGEGVCHHQCSSFVALCRAAGIPARVAHGVVLNGSGAFADNAGSHGWASVYLEPLGWVPVDPLDRSSLVLFGRSNYLLTDYANETPEDNHFAYRSIQGFSCDGEVLALEAAPE